MLHYERDVAQAASGGDSKGVYYAGLIGLRPDLAGPAAAPELDQQARPGQGQQLQQVLQEQEWAGAASATRKAA